MTGNSPHATPVDLVHARDNGRREGFAIAALALALISFLNLLSLEKSILAIVLAVTAMSGPASRRVKRRSLIALGLAVLHIVTIAVVLVLFRDELGQLIQLLHKLG